ncbi:hypothetical protein DRJ16_01235 [Candidatus Woesearchaeota archaeon]|nr:MAG: hypothetical protein DRJ16_01235 [Candidatus Woesearchaeota archaeon]
MCESNAFKGDEKIMENVAVLKVKENSNFVLEDIKGNSKEIQGKLLYIDFIKHRIVFE